VNLGGGVVLLFASRAIEQAREIQSLAGDGCLLASAFR
jgi:hypothetical protein